MLIPERSGRTGAKILAGHQIAGRGKVGNGRAFDQDLKYVSQSAPVASARCCGQPHDDGAAVRLHEPHVCAGTRMMRLADDQQIRRRQIDLAGSYRASVQRLDRCNLNPRCRPSRESRLDDPVVDADCMQLLRDLIREFAPVDNKLRHALSV